MKLSALKHFRQSPRPFVTEGELKMLLPGTLDSRQGKLQRLLAQNLLVHIRRGLYGLTEEMGYPRKPHPFELALFIYGPSYVSLESALSYHQLIPEAVHTTTSVCTARSKTFHTPFGLFSYQRLPTLNFFTDVAQVKENNYQFMIANPWKAICDYLYCYKKDWHTLEPLAESLRLDIDKLPPLSKEKRTHLDQFYHQKRISLFLKSIEEK